LSRLFFLLKEKMSNIDIHQSVKPYIQFETRAEEDRNASVEAGKKIYRDVDWIIATPIGGRDVVENKAADWLAAKRDQARCGHYDPEWVSHYEKMYELFKQGKDLPEDGTPLSMCSTLFSPGEIKNLLGANIRTLEALAGANEEALGRLQMMGRALKSRAQEAIAVGDKGGAALKVEALRIENDELKRRIDDLTNVVEKLSHEKGKGKKE
jgi:hypothetical protein